MTQKLDESQIKTLLQERKPTEQSQKIVEKKTKLVAINEIRKQVGLDTVDKVDDISMKDKRAFLMLESFWRNEMTREHCDELLSEIYEKEIDAKA